MKSFKGLALIEVIIVIGLIAILSVFLSSNTVRSRNSIALDTTIDSLINDVKGQQIQAMTGFNQFGEVNNSYGIYFEQNRYILFHSPAYQQGLATNFSITLENGNQFVLINLPSNQIIFASTSGKIENYDQNNNSVTILNSNTGTQKTIHFNSYGVVYAFD